MIGNTDIARQLTLEVCDPLVVFALTDIKNVGSLLRRIPPPTLYTVLSLFLSNT